MNEAWFVAVIIFVLLIVLATIRLATGPTAPDRVVALDTINTLIVTIMVVLAVAYQQLIFVDVAIVYAVLSFVSTLFIAKYLAGEI